MARKELIATLLVGNNVLGFFREIFENKSQTLRECLKYINDKKTAKNKYLFLHEIDYIDIFDSLESFFQREMLAEQDCNFFKDNISAGEFIYHDKFIIKEMSSRILVFKYMNNKRSHGEYFAVPLSYFLEKIDLLESIGNEMKKHASAIESRNNGSRSDIYNATEDYINYCIKTGQIIPDDVLADNLDSRISLIMLPGKEPFPESELERLKAKLKEEFNKSEELGKKTHRELCKLFASIFINKAALDGNLYPADYTLSSLSLARALCVIGSKLLSREESEYYLKISGKLIKEP